MAPTVARPSSTTPTRSVARSAIAGAPAPRGRSRRPSPRATRIAVMATATATFESFNPSTGEVIESFPRSTAEDVDRAVDAALEAWEGWRLTPAPERGNILFRFAQLLEQHKNELADLMTREMGKVKAEAGGDVQEAIDMSYYMGGEGRRLFGQTTPSELRDKFMMSVRMPVGVVGAITPWNFPIAIPSWKLAPALVCGNTVALKPAEDTPLLAERFVELVAAAEGLRLGPGWEDETDVGPLINRAALDKVHSYTAIGESEGAKLLTGGEIAENGGGLYYRPTVFGDAEPGMRIAQEEIFGPTTALIPVESFDEAVAAANSVRYGLSSSIYTRDVNRAFRAMRDLQTGITYINAGTTGAEVHLPFGGTKETGNGHREAGQAALDVFTEWKSIYVDYSGKLQRAQIDNV